MARVAALMRPGRMKPTHQKLLVRLAEQGTASAHAALMLAAGLVLRVGDGEGDRQAPWHGRALLVRAATPSPESLDAHASLTDATHSDAITHARHARRRSAFAGERARLRTGHRRKSLRAPPEAAAAIGAAWMQALRPRCVPRRRSVTWRPLRQPWKTRSYGSHSSTSSARLRVITTRRRLSRSCECGRTARVGRRTTCAAQRLTRQPLRCSRYWDPQRRLRARIWSALLRAGTRYHLPRGAQRCQRASCCRLSSPVLMPACLRARRPRRCLAAASSAARNMKTTVRRSASCANLVRTPALL